MLLETERLVLAPVTLELIEALPSGDKAREAAGADIPEGWPDDELAGLLALYASWLRADRTVVGYGPWLVIARDQGVVVGSAGFVGKPTDDGSIELGFGVHPRFRNRGYASESSRALVNWGLAQPGVERVVARCDPHNLPSIRVLEKLRMARRGERAGQLLWEATLRLRELRDEDSVQVAALYAIAYGDARRLDAEEVRSWLRNESLAPDWLRVLELDGRVVGYADVDVHAEELVVDLAAPGHWEPLLEWAEASARAAGVPRVRIFFAPNDELAGVLERRGYRPWRLTYTLEGDLDETTPPAPPHGFELHPYRPDRDEAQLLDAINEVFHDDPFFHQLSPSRFRENYLRARGYDPSLWLLAWRGHDVAGFALGLAEHAGDTEVGWIESLGVRAPWRGRGLGETLLRSTFAKLYARGLRRIGLGVDAENATGALSLYEKVGMRPVSRGENWVRDLV